MSLSTVLLRVLLCVGLIFNGSGAAVASADMQVAHVQRVDAAHDHHGTVDDDAKAACHGGAMAMAKGGHHAAGMDNDATGCQTTADHSADCCDSGVCRGDCVQQLQLIVDAPWTRDIVAGPADNVRPMAPAHAPPILPHLIRPPIRQVS